MSETDLQGVGGRELLRRLENAIRAPQYEGVRVEILRRLAVVDTERRSQAGRR